MTRWVFISDTHNRHSEFHPPKGDVLCHLGDFLVSPKDVTNTYDFFKWFRAQAHEYKILVKGNHDPKDERWLESLSSDHGITYLNHDIVEIRGKKVLGLMNVEGPVFVKDKIDVLLSHYPPFGILDEVPIETAFGPADFSCGSRRMLDLVDELKPQLHAFGHIHECGQQVYCRSPKGRGTTFLNACAFGDKKRNESIYNCTGKMVVDL